MAFLDRFIDTEKTSKVEVKSPRDIYYGILKGTSGTSYTREINVDIFYTTYGFKGIVEGVGCSTLVANVAQAIADMGLTVCVIDTSILNPVQDILLKTDVEFEDPNTHEEGKTDKRLDWFDMPYTRKSVLHESKLNRNISVLSFKGKAHTIVDFLSTNDSDTLVEMALSEIHTKFDIVLIDICHEPSSVATACLQQSQKIFQVWNDAPTVLGNLERFLTNQVLLACPMDKMSNVIYSKIQRDALGSLDNVLKEYKFNKAGVTYFSEEVALQAVVGNNLFQLPSNDKNVIAYTDCIIDVACIILNLTEDRAETKAMAAQKGKKGKGIIKTEDILNGKVEGTATKKLRDRETKIKQDLGIAPVDSVNDLDKDGGFVDAYKEEGFITSIDEFTQSLEAEEPRQTQAQPDVDIENDPDFHVLNDENGFIEDEASDSADIEFEPTVDTEDSEEEFSADEFEASDDIEQELSDFEAELDKIEEPTSGDNPVDAIINEPIDVPDSFLEDTEEPIQNNELDTIPAETFEGEIPEVEFEESADNVSGSDVETIMNEDTDDFVADDEFLEESSTDEVPSDDNSSTDDEFFDEDDFENGQDDSVTDSSSEQASDDFAEFEDFEPSEEEETGIQTDETPILESFDTSSEESEFTDDFVEETTENGGITEEETPINEQLATSDDTETPISEEVAADFEESNDSDEFFEETSGDDGKLIENEPISEDTASADEATEPLKESFEESSEELIDTDDFEEAPADEPTEDITPVEDKEDEFFDTEDDFESAPTSEGGSDEEFLMDNNEETPISDQSEGQDETSEPIIEDENTSDSDEFADDDEFLEDTNSTDASAEVTSEDDEFLDDDDDFFFDDDENMQALQNYVKSQNTEFDS